jgi:uncharacterized membrane protein YqjE
MKLVSKAFYFSFSLLMMVTLVVVIAWLFDSKPENLYQVWERGIILTGILFILHLLFGGNKN